ncbi:hypothetical protein [Plantactinospora sp. GCM10030261]|uniref:hypothetical protein n=1 Tax=Plantactinospora sp. GCM10030261 TaxID=3273420 RepID=UPI0036105E3A
MTALPLTRPSRTPMLAAAVTIGWFGTAFLASALGAFRTAPGAPPVALATAALAPPLAVLALALGSSRFRTWARGLDLRFLTLLQTWRVGGLAFLALLAVDALPAAFALPAGLGDVAIGLTAPLVAAFVVGRSSRLFVAWTAFGVADLVAAVTLGALYAADPVGLRHSEVSTELMTALPMSLIPVFGVPITLVAHTLSLIKLAGSADPHPLPGVR